MDLLFKILKVGALVALIFVLVFVSVPTLKGVFVIIHFTTTLNPWLLLLVLVVLGFAFAAHLLLTRITVVSQAVAVGAAPRLLRFIPATTPLRC
jgi:hypothetical protein